MSTPSIAYVLRVIIVGPLISYQYREEKTEPAASTKLSSMMLTAIALRLVHYVEVQGHQMLVKNTIKNSALR